MSYYLAILAGRLAMLFVGLASAYYLLFRVLNSMERGGLVSRHLKGAVAFARSSHPYVASLISLSAFYHVYVMWMTHPLGLKVASGLLVSLTVVLMANSGWALKLRPRTRWLRRLHRDGMLAMLAVLLIHRLI